MSTDTTMIKTRPILFQPAMAQAAHEGSKTQTRRLVKGITDPDLFEELGDGGFLHAKECPSYCDYACGGREIVCPHGVPGDRLWVREAWAYFGGDEYLYQKERDQVMFKASWDSDPRRPVWCNTDEPIGDRKCWDGRWRPSIHMPRWACRTVLEVVKVRVERVRDCRFNTADLEAEGMTLPASELYPHTNRASKLAAKYAALWDSINGAGSWAANPWAWVIEFKRVQP